MSEPEIARRCPSCGASVRAPALFCAQCGKRLADPQPHSAAVSTDAQADIEGHSETELLADTSKVTASKEFKFQDFPSGSNRASALSPAVPLKPGTSVAPGTVQLASPAREVNEEALLNGVGKLRQISSVVLDEAAYDPSLRFVLVAAALFVLFLVILLLSELIT